MCPSPVPARLPIGDETAGGICDSGEAKPTILVVGTDDWAIEQGAGSLEASGHRVLRCHEPGQPAFPCNALRESAECPLNVGFDLVITMRSRPMSPPGPGEFGVVCGVRSGAALLVGGLTANNPFDRWAAGTVEIADDLTTAVSRVRLRSAKPHGSRADLG